MTVKLWVFTTKRTLFSLRDYTRRKSARYCNRRAMDSPSRNQRRWLAKSIYGKSLRTHCENSCGCKPHYPFQLLFMRVPNINGLLQCLSRRVDRTAAVGRVFVDLLHFTRRLGKPNLLPPPVHGWGFFAARARPRPAAFLLRPSLNKFSPQKKIFKIFLFFSQNRLTNLNNYAIISIQNNGGVL